MIIFWGNQGLQEKDDGLDEEKMETRERSWRSERRESRTRERMWKSRRR